MRSVGSDVSVFATAIMLPLCVGAGAQTPVVSYEFPEGAGTSTADSAGAAQDATFVAPGGGEGNLATWISDTPNIGGANDSAVEFPTVLIPGDPSLSGVDNGLPIRSAYDGVAGSGSRTAVFYLKSDLHRQTQEDDNGGFTMDQREAYVQLHWGGGGPAERWTIRINNGGGTYANAGEAPNGSLNTNSGVIGGIRNEVAGSFQVGTTNVLDGAWHQVAVVYDDDIDPSQSSFLNETRIYVDGRLESITGSGGDIALATTTGSGSDPVTIGGRSFSSHATGYYVSGSQLDSVHVYDEALDISTITSLHALPTPAITGDLDRNGQLQLADDADPLMAAVRRANQGIAYTDDVANYDLNGDNTVDQADIIELAENAHGSYQGDADGDGDVDFADFVALSNNFGKLGGWSEGNFDADGDVLVESRQNPGTQVVLGDVRNLGAVNFADFVALSNNFGSGAALVTTAVPSASVVPEPTSLALFAAASSLVLVRRRRTG